MTEIQRTPPLTLVSDVAPPVPHQTVWQQNASAFATTAEDATAAERHDGVRRALGYLMLGQRGRAQYELTRSVVRQARIAGLGTHDIPPACPCGGDHRG